MIIKFHLGLLFCFQTLSRISDINPHITSPTICELHYLAQWPVLSALHHLHCDVTYYSAHICDVTIVYANSGSLFKCETIENSEFSCLWINTMHLARQRLAKYNVYPKSSPPFHKDPVQIRPRKPGRTQPRSNLTRFTKTPYIYTVA